MIYSASRQFNSELFIVDIAFSSSLTSCRPLTFHEYRESLFCRNFHIYSEPRQASNRPVSLSSTLVIKEISSQKCIWSVYVLEY